MKTKKRRKSLDERLEEVRASADAGPTDTRRSSTVTDPVEPAAAAEEIEPTAIAPVPTFAEPERAFDQPAPEIQQPAPEINEPAPTVQQPAPAVYEPAPVFVVPAAPVEEPVREMDEPALVVDELDQPAPEINQPAPEVNEPALRFDTAVQGVDEIARAVAALATTEGDDFLPGRAGGPRTSVPGRARAATPVVSSARPELVEPDELFARADPDAADKAVEALLVTPEASMPSMSEPAHDPGPVEPAPAGSTALPTGLMDRWISPRRARKAMAHAAPAVEPEEPRAIAEEAHTATLATLARDEIVDPIVAVITTEPETVAEPEAVREPETPTAPAFPAEADTLIAQEILAEPEVRAEPETVKEPEAAPIESARSGGTDGPDGPVASDTDTARPPRSTRGGEGGRVGSTMIERGLISDEQLSRALEIQRGSGRRVGEILVELGALTSIDLARVLAEHFGVAFTDLRAEPPDPILARFLPEEVARRYDALAIARRNDQLVIAMANPTDLFALDDLQLVTRQPVIATMAVKEDLQAAIERVYRGSIVETTLDAATSDYKSAEAEIAATQAIEVNEGPIVGLVSALLTQAITDRASDLHVEPCSTHVAVRFRVDGVLHDSSDVPLELLRPLVSRLKILSGLDIAQNRVAQDGRFSLTIRGRSVDVRVVTMPTAAGESVILRLLDPVRDSLGVASLGLEPAELDRFIPAFQGSQGAVFIVGPTGSGKTSTVYAVLSEINTRAKSIISVEDPVEFRLDGVKQIQMNQRVGLTFATTLPSVLRADPDVVFIGEVRDSETARIAADASITGHLVLSTIHATRAAATPMRLIEMGVEPYLVASALTLVASQRLARKLCEHCSEAADASGVAHLRGLGADESLLDGATIRRAVGCPACRNTGYRGRLPIFEIMPITESISRLILDRAPRLEIERVAVGEGMDTLDRAALRRVVQGDLSIEEMVRVIS